MKYIKPLTYGGMAAAGLGFLALLRKLFKK